MPRVSEEHLAARRQQILVAARTCFLRNGFHQTSMQDVKDEAGLSIGAVYRYFPSKTDLITAIAEEVIERISLIFDQFLAQEPPPPVAAALDTAVDLITAETGPDGTLRLALQIWSEATHDPALAEFVGRVYSRIRDILIKFAARAAEHGDLPAGADPNEVGVVLFALMPGYALQRILTGGPAPETFKAGLRTLLP